ncbi:MAG TPA: 3-hydroxyacyl-CoA dehydrogenase family protein [bacterium]|nr:3-hydroxyacyl-CoA dehydrogenase family protein [bacterium]
MAETGVVRSAAVVGAGTMGAAIAGALARAGGSVALVDRSPQLLERGLQALRVSQRTLVDAGVITAEQAGAAEARVRAHTSLEEACAGIDLLVESVTEDLEIKRKLLSSADRACPPSTIFASNTSGLSITRLAEATGRPHAVAGMHFYNPAHIMPLVEVVRGEQTSEETAQFLLALARHLGKRPILVRRDVPGFVGNRLQFALVREALHLLESGVASAEDIDTAITAGPGLRYAQIGPFATADLAGLDVFDAISRYLFSDLARETEPPPVLHRLVAEGRIGVKAGRGFYEYPAGDASRLIARRDRLLLAFLDALAHERTGGTDG